jgi:NAD kinase
MPALIPRAVIVTRPTDYEVLLARYGTRAQVRFALKESGQTLEVLDERHRRVAEAIENVSHGVPAAWRTVRLSRTELDRFVFEPSDIVLVVGQDGLVANVAKYLQNQPVIGFNPDPQLYEGVLVPNEPTQSARLIQAVVSSTAPLEQRTMVQASLDDGQTLVALNEIFIGHRSHQSARYCIRVRQHEERQSSSGVIISTGTGSTGWGRSINAQRKSPLTLPKPTDPSLALFVREAFPGRGFFATLIAAILHNEETAVITSEMDEAGVIFGDGIEEDRLVFPWGATVSVRVASRRLNLVDRPKIAQAAA